MSSIGRGVLHNRVFPALRHHYSLPPPCLHLHVVPQLTQLRAKPIYKVLANGWEQAFQRRTPLILKQSVTSFDKILQTFHQCLVDRAAEEGVLNPRLGMLGHQIKQYTRVFQDLANGMITLINEKQKDANREFTPVVQEKMDNAYMLCVAERGRFHRDGTAHEYVS